MKTPQHVGKVLVSISSYNMTFVKFFQVVAETPSGKTLTLRRVRENIVEGNSMFGKVVGLKDVFWNNDETDVWKVRTANAPRLWDGTPQYFNSID